MTTDKLDLYEIDLSVSGWDAIFNADIQKIDDGISTIEILEYGETIAAYEAVYIKSDGKAWLAEADGTKQPAFGIAIDAGVSTDEKRIRTNGHIENTSWAWTEIGGYIYLDDSTPGALTDTEPASNAQPLGTIMSATEIFVFVSNNIGSSTSNFLTVQDEGSVIDTAVTSINFIGAGVTAVENLSHEIDVTIAAGSAPVDTVNGQTGTVVLDADDISDTATTNKFVTAAEITAIGVNTAKISLTDNSVTLAKMAPGTDGNLITYDTNGAPAYVATGTGTHVLTSNGAGAAPTFQAATGGYTPGTPIAMEDAVISRPKFLDVSETVNALGALGGGTDDIDLEDGNVVTATVSTVAQTLTFSNPPATGSNGSFTLFLTNGGSQTITWPTSVDWVGGTAPTLTTAGVDILVFTTNDAGTVWSGFVAGLDVK